MYVTNQGHNPGLAADRSFPAYLAGFGSGFRCGGVLSILRNTSSGWGRLDGSGCFTGLDCAGMIRLSAVVTRIPMTPRDLLAHKLAPKTLKEIPDFKPQKRNKLPKPFKGLGGPKIQSTGMIDVSGDHVAIMYWRDGAILTDRSFYGHLFCRLAKGNLSPIFEFHWHPSHKGFHCKTPCRTDSNYTDRNLPGAPELSLKTNANLDPKSSSDRLQLVVAFCDACGISLPTNDAASKTLW